MLAPEYSIDGVELVMYGGHTRTITPLERAESGFGVSLNQAIKPPDKINVKVRVTFMYIKVFDKF